jgi:uncharacterized paraquat-inducible protein A
MADTVSRLVQIRSLPDRSFTWSLSTACQQCGASADIREKNAMATAICPACGNIESLGVDGTTFVVEVVAALDRNDNR